MTDPIFFATDNGLTTGRFEAGRLSYGPLLLEGTAITAVAVASETIVAGTRTGIRLSSDRGDSWREPHKSPAIPHIRWLLAHPDRPGFVFAGTEPAGIFVSADAGLTWTGRPEVEALRDEHGWWLPYSPESGCVRGFAFHGDRGYAAVEVGGVLRTDDGGATWNLAPGSSGDPQFREPPAGYIHADVHSVETHPSSPDLVFAATNAGLYRSRDGGGTFQRINADGYTRAVWIDPQNPDHIASGPAASVGRSGTVVESVDGGETWEPLTGGLDTPWPNTMVERFHGLAGSRLAAVLDDGRLFICNLGTRRWEPGPNLDAGIRGMTA